MRWIAIVVSLLCTSVVVTRLVDPGLPVLAAAAAAPTVLLDNPGTDAGNERGLLSALVIPALVQRSLLRLPAPRKRGQRGIVLGRLLSID